MKRPLDGIKVVEYGNFIAAPYCARLLADFGAEVIKIEDPGMGDESRKRGPFPMISLIRKKAASFVITTGIKKASP
jgi:crotonobetainyl-CoA:carnitine CoA-transferase CaiB-like acyl-CoA transferase